MAIRSSAAFCKIAARIQDRMANTSLIPPAELKQFDEELLAWHSNIHPILREAKHSPEQIRMASLMLQFRYLNQRMVLYRPYILTWCVIKTDCNQAPCSEEVLSFADMCNSIALETVKFANDSWYPSQILAWNSTWFLFQAALVVLLKLLAMPSQADTEQQDRAIRESLKLLDQMRKWRSPAADSHDLIQFIYESRVLKKDDLGADPILSDDTWMTFLGLGPNDDHGWSDALEFGSGDHESSAQFFQL